MISQISNPIDVLPNFLFPSEHVFKKISFNVDTEGDLREIYGLFQLQSI